MKALAISTHKWGRLASGLMAMALIVPAVIYLMGDLRPAIGPLRSR